MELIGIVYTVTQIVIIVVVIAACMNSQSHVYFSIYR